MAMKRFVAPDMRRALDLVRQHLGPDAIILSSKRTAEGVEIITSTELDYTTRGAQQAQDFRKKFDEDFDGPLASDSAWQAQNGVASAVNHYRTPPAPKFDRARSEQLAAEIEAARERMLAAKQGEGVGKRANAPVMPSQNLSELARMAISQNPPARQAATKAPAGESPISIASLLQPKIPESTAAVHAPVEQPTASSAHSPEHVPSLATMLDTQPASNPPTHTNIDASVASVNAAVDETQYSNEPPAVPQTASKEPASHQSVTPPVNATVQPITPTVPVEQLAVVDRQMSGLREQLAKMEAAQSLSSKDSSNMNALRDEIADMRMLLEQQMWRMKEEESDPFSDASPLIESLKSHLTALGLPAELVKKLSAIAKPGQRLNAAWRSALAHLTKNIAVDSSDPINDGGIFAFVGPTGVGKTTTIAKLAARYVLKHGMNKVALITTDTFRVGAHDQLRSLGRILNVPVRVVDKERSLPSVIRSLKDYPLIMIDTAGFRHGDPMLREQEELLDSCPGLKRVLVLASNSQRQTLKASAHAFKSTELRGCIITKLDETGSLGETLGVLSQQKIPMLYSADGQNIPNDLSVASASSLVAKAVNLMKIQRDAEKTFAASV